MSLGLHKNELSFLILDTDNPKTLVFVDTSFYYKNPERPLMEIVPPGFNKYFLTNIVARKVNTLNSNTIGITDIIGTHCLSELGDGVWTFKYKICPYDEVFIVQYHLRTVKLEQSLKELYREIDLSSCGIEENEDLKIDIIDSELAISSGKAWAEKGNAKKASDLYQIANSIITKRLAHLSKSC